MPKFKNDQEGILSSDLYSEVFERKGRKFLKIRRTKDLSVIRGIEIEVSTEHIWSYGDSLHKLSNKFYGTNENWWIIGLLNKKPTDGHYKIGDIVYIPRDINKIKGEL